MVEEEKYFIMSRCEDEVGFQVLTKEEMLKYLQEAVLEETLETNYIDDAGASTLELDYFPSCSALIIKGRVVVPTPTEVVKKLEIE